MILTFTKPKFEDLIKKKIKQHTIRTDRHNRWKVGMKIHFWNGNPRNTRGKNKPYQFGTGIVERIEPIEIYPKQDLIIISGYQFRHPQELKNIAWNDGFESWDEMKDFFSEDFIGKVIIWSDCVWSQRDLATDISE